MPGRWFDSLRGRRTGQKNGFEGRRLENPKANGREIARDGKAWADSILIQQQLIVIPAEASIDCPIAEAD